MKQIMSPFYQELNGAHTIGASQPKANDCKKYSIRVGAEFDANPCRAAEK
jgi:hypothetical protein